MVDALVMVVDRYGKQLLSPLLPYYILVEISMYLLRFQELFNLPGLRCGRLLQIMDIVIAELHAVAADGRIKSLKHQRHLMFAPAAEYAIPFSVCFSLLGHLFFPL